MAADIRITVDLAGFGAFQQAALDALEKALAESAQAIADDAQAVVPVDTGALKSSIQASKISPLEWEVEAGNETVNYAIFVELGTSKMAAQPYFTPAVEAEAARFEERIAKALAEAMRG